MKVTTLIENEWLELKKMVDVEQGVSGYIYSHEKRCEGKIVTILPYRFIDGKLEYLLRCEVTPCWTMKPVISSITGGYNGIGIEETVVEEIHEEAGYKVSIDDLIDLGEMYGTKSSDTVYSLYSVNLTGKKNYEAVGDGSELEKKAHCFWTKDLSNVKDPFVFALHYKLTKSIIGK